MRKVTLQLYITLDGVNEFPNYPGAGDPPPGEEDPVSNEMWNKNWESTDTLLFDLENYRQWREFWPPEKRTAEEHPWYRRMSEFATRAQKVVFSDVEEETTWANTRFLRGDVAEGVARLRSEPGRNMALVGSTVLAQEFQRRDLIDDYFLAVFPVILGRGARLFGELERQVTLRLVESKSFRGGELFLHYSTVR